jgi:hypothetical protein
MTERQQTTKHMSPGLQMVAERAERDPDARFNSLAHLLDVEALRRAFDRIRKGAAVGVDGVTKCHDPPGLAGKFDKAPSGAGRCVDPVRASIALAKS